MRKASIFHLFLILLFLVFYSTSCQIQESRFDEILSAQYPADGPGCVALVAKEGNVIYRKAFGMADLELDVALKPENVFRIGSITKQFTACAILRLMEEGKLTLQDDITDYIEDFPTHGHTITIEHLLTHTSGIRSYTGIEKWTPEVRKNDFTPGELIDFFKNEPMDFEPGERHLYNNSAYFMLGYIIEEVSGQTYEEYLDENFFKPLGMENSYYGNTTRIIRNRASGYQKNGDEYQNANFLSMTQPYAAGSLLSTVDDLFTWYQAVMNYEVVSRESLEKAHTRSRLNNGQEIDYGYGWALQYIQQSPAIEHGGGINGYLTYSLYLPEEKVFVAVFTNCDCNPPGEAAARIAAITIGKPFEWEEIEMPDETLRDLEGVYKMQNDDRRIITFEDGKLYSQRNRGPKYRILPFDADQFFFEEGIETLSFKRNQEGDIESVILSGRASPQKCDRCDEPLPRDEE